MNKQHENSLTFFKLLTNNSFDIISLLNAGGTIVFESNSTERILGYASGERNGLKAFDFVHPDDRQLVIRVFNDLLEEPEGHRSAEFRYQHKNGKWIWLESNAQNFINRPDINGIVINSRDITKKKQEEQKLIETVELNKSIVNSTHDCFKTIDLEGNLLYMNQGGQELMEIDSVDSCLNLS
jgi:PAS domain S-box-containing protein